MESFFSFAKLHAEHYTRGCLGEGRTTQGQCLCLQPEKVGEKINEYFALVFTKEKGIEDTEIMGQTC